MSKIKRRSECVNSLDFEGFLRTKLRKVLILEAISASIFARNIRFSQLSDDVLKQVSGGRRLGAEQPRSNMRST
jgi:hypothetical protein